MPRLFRKTFIWTKRLLLRIFEYWYMQFHFKHISGPRKITRDPNDCVVVAVVRDAESTLNVFIEYYLDLGFKHIFLLDNGSKDRTLEIASEHENVTIGQCLLPFGLYKDQMRYFLLQKFSMNKWCLVADGDEFFCYPRSSKINLSEFIQYLNKNHYDAVLTQMLDMYPQDDIQQLSSNFLVDHKWFEVDSITQQEIPSGLENKLSNPELRLHYGGVRKRIFETNPCLSKFAFTKTTINNYRVGLHLISWSHIADLSCSLMHYKFAGDFLELVNKAIVEKQYFKGSEEYKKYQEVLESQGKISLLDEISIEFETLEKLIDIGFLKESKQYKEYCSSISLGGRSN